MKKKKLKMESTNSKTTKTEENINENSFDLYSEIVEKKTGHKFKTYKFLLYEDKFILTKMKDSKTESEKSKSFNLLNCRITINSNNQNEFIIYLENGKNLIFNLKDENKRKKLIEKIYFRILNINKKTLSNDFFKEESEIEKLTSNCFDKDIGITKSFHKLNNLINELNDKQIELDKICFKLKDNNNIYNKLITISSSFQCISDLIKKNIDQIIETYFHIKFSNEFNANKIKQSLRNSFQMRTSQSLLNSNFEENNKIENNNFDSDDDFEDCNSSISQLRNSVFNSININKNINEINNNNNNNNIRKNLNKKFYFESYGKDIFNLGNLKSLPINYREPLTTLQRESEILKYFYFLNQASEQKEISLQLVYISAFCISCLSLNTNRFLFPFNSLLGETFEYFDNNNNLRFFAEQVTLEISAFFAEGKNVEIFGDNRNEKNFKILKRGIEIIFKSKIQINIKNDNNNQFIFNWPNKLIKGLIIGDIEIEYTNDIVIQCLNNEEFKCVIKFQENKENNFIGKIYKNNEILYIIKGNYRKFIYFTDNKEQNKINLININEEIFYENNKDKDYFIPSFSYNLNYLPENLENFLPPTDSRFRPDLREYENGNNSIAEEINKILLKKEEEKIKKLSDENKLYQPVYFKEIFNQNINNYFYKYKGNYWEDRNQKNWKGLNKDIFLIKNN